MLQAKKKRISYFNWFLSVFNSIVCSLKNWRLIGSFILLLTGMGQVGYGQEMMGSTLRNKTIHLTDSAGVELDTLSIDPASLRITFQNERCLDSLYQFNLTTRKLLWKGPLPAKIECEYRVFSIDLSTPYFHKDSNKIIGNLSLPDPIFSYSVGTEKSALFQFSDLSKNGSISRGITFGNNQDLGVNSNLSLQLKGKVASNINILASISDNNIPIQPEGNTQQLQDFDQAFIQLFNDRFELTAGDFWMKPTENYFLQYRKKAQGISFKTSLLPEDQTSKTQFWNMAADAALSKGKFGRNVIQGLEGNQGPYKLIGAENEPFIIVLSGTERVFIDGKLLTRGQENDYLIDYNTAEITFTTRNLITKDRRIVVEFQYSDKNYARSVLTVSTDYKKDRWKLGLKVYSEQDSKNQPLQQVLDNERRSILTAAGDNLNTAFTNASDSVGFSDNQLLYAKIDSFGYEVYVFNTSPDSAFYQLSFSEVGTGNGDYVFDEFTPFGRKYKWIKPDTVNSVITHHGNFAPIILLVAPKKRQMVTANAAYNFSKKTSLSIESAWTNSDINTFSSIGNEDNTGFGVKAGFKTQKELWDSSGWKLNGKMDAEYRHQNFEQIERYRPVEFERNWNILRLTDTASQLLTNGIVGLEKKGVGKFNYQFGSLNMEEVYNGFRNGWDVLLTLKGIYLDYKGSWVLSDANENTRFFRHKTHAYGDIKWLRIGYLDELENNRFTAQIADSLLGTSYAFHDRQVYLSTSKDTKNTFKVYYRNRAEQRTNKGTLSQATLAHHTGGELQLIKNPKHRLKTVVEYRELQVRDTALVSIAPDQTVVGRIEYNLKAWKGLLSSATYYEIGSGQELKREFAYLEVQPGQGVYAWIDYNNNGVKEINEFEIAAFPDQAKYIRVFTPTNEYIKTFTNQLNQTLSIRPGALWRNSKRQFQKWLSKFEDQTALRIDRKTSTESGSTLYNPFILEVADTALISINASIRNTVFFQRAHAKFGMDYTYQQLRSKVLLSSGFDIRSTVAHEARIRWNFNRRFGMETKVNQGIKENESDYTTGRNYQIYSWGINPRLTYQPNSKFRVSLIGTWTNKENKLTSEGERAKTLDGGIEVKYSTINKGSFNANFNVVNIDYSGEENAAIGFEMLNGLKNGLNLTWSFNFQKTLSNNLQISLNYLGRKSKNNNAIHTGGVQVRAFF